MCSAKFRCKKTIVINLKTENSQSKILRGGETRAHATRPWDGWICILWKAPFRDCGQYLYLFFYYIYFFFNGTVTGPLLESQQDGSTGDGSVLLVVIKTTPLPLLRRPLDHRSRWTACCSARRLRQIRCRSLRDGNDAIKITILSSTLNNSNIKKACVNYIHAYPNTHTTVLVKSQFKSDRFKSDTFILVSPRCS